MLISLETFSKVMQKRARIKKKILRGKHASFINRELRKEICKRNRLRNKPWKDPSKENDFLFKTQRNKCVSLQRSVLKLSVKMLPRKVLLQISRFGNCHIQNDTMLIDNDNLTDTWRKLNVRKTSRTSFERLVCVQFTSCVYGDGHEVTRNKNI